MGDPEVALKVGTALSAANAGYMFLAPGKVAEMYGMTAPTPLIEWFCEFAGGVMLSIVLTTWLAIGGMDFTTAVAWGGVPTLVQSVKDLLNSKGASLGFGTLAQYMPVAINAFFTAALFGKLSFITTDLALKIWSGWTIFNGVAGYLAPAAFMKGWEAPLNSPAEEAMAKFFCGILGCSGAFMGSVAFMGHDIMKAAAVGWGAFLLTNLEGLFISKSSDTLGVDKNAGSPGRSSRRQSSAASRSEREVKAALRFRTT